MGREPVFWMCVVFGMVLAVLVAVLMAQGPAVTGRVVSVDRDGQVID